MRTKTLLITAAISAAGIASSMGQVYSINMVGYINKPIPTGFSMVANQLTAVDNHVSAIFGNPPVALSVNKFVPGVGYNTATYNPEDGWDAIGQAMLLAPGEGVFLDSQGPFTLTTVGEVKLSSTLNIHPGLDIYSSVIPQELPFDDASLGFPPIPAGTLTVFRFAGGGLVPYTYDSENGFWAPEAPKPAVGEAIWMDNDTGGTLVWTRTFPVGP